MSSVQSFYRQLIARSTCVTLVAAILLAPLPALAATPDTVIFFRPHCDAQSEDGDTILGPIPDVEELVSLGDTVCPSFEVEDPQTLKTQPLRAGDVLSFDVAIRNPSKQSINHVRSWVAYDPNVFEGIRIEISQNFPMVTPGESDFDHANGYAMIEASNDAEGANQAGILAVARVQLRAKISPESGTFISFYDAQREGHTTVTTKENGTDEYIVGEEPGGLHVLFASVPGQEGGNTNTPPPSGGNEVPQNLLEGGEGNANPEPTTPPQEEPNELSWDGGSCTKDADCWTFNCVEEICVDPSTTGTQDPPPQNETPNTPEGTGEGNPDNTGPPSENEEVQEGVEENSDVPERPLPPQDRTPFSLLQVRNVRTTTEGSAILLAWDKLNSSSLKGYSIYYGTTTGRYIQRKTVDGELNSLILRALPLNTTYYLAVRAVNTEEEESAFSQEVSVKVGDPTSSTAPLVENQVVVAPGVPSELIPEVNGQPVVPGETGIPSTLALLFILCAGVGTLLASRRQIIALSHPSSHE
jgi:hypothetical protein